MRLEGPKILIEGPAGTGKTHALGTLVDWAARQTPPRKVHVVFTERGLETLLGYWTERNLPVPTNLSWTSITQAPLPLTSLIDGARKSGSMTYEALTKSVDANRAANNPWEKFLTVLSDVPNDRDGTKLGNIGEWDECPILINDFLSESANMCFKMVTGNKPVAAPPEYLVAQNNLLNWLRYMTQAFKGTFVITAHVQRQINEVAGTSQLMTKAIGKAMGDEIPQLFSEVIYTVRLGAEWWWETAAANVDTKVRYLPIATKIKPDFALIMDKWLARSKAAKGGA